MSRDRLSRLLQLITLLQSGQNRTAADLTDLLGVSRRTLFRDLKTLQDSGIPCYHEPNVGYRIARSFFLPPISLTVPETMGLLLLGKVAITQRGRGYAPQALSAIQKLITTVPGPMREACTELMSHVHIEPHAQAISEKEPAIYATLQECINEARPCDVTYQGPLDEEPMVIRLEPYLLHFSQRAWYVMGRTEMHDEVRVLKLARINEIKTVKARFDRPHNFLPKDKLGLAWQLIPEGKEYDVELLFTAKVAVNVTEVQWHSTQDATILDDGRARVKFRVDGLNEIAWWVCGYADQVEVKKPAKLRKMVQHMLARAALQYDR